MATVLVTGANRGIGLELVRQCAARGDRVIAACRDPAGAGELAQLTLESSGLIEVHPLDVASDASVEALSAVIGRRSIDILINNAGIIGPGGLALATDLDGFAQTLAVNTIAPLRMAMAFASNLRPAGADAAPGKLATISSQMGSLAKASSDRIAYRASKAAANTVMLGVAAEMRSMGVAVILLHPGWVRTGMGGAGADLSPQESAAGLLNQINTLTLAGSGAFLDYSGRRMPW